VLQVAGTSLPLPTEVCSSTSASIRWLTIYLAAATAATQTTAVAVNENGVAGPAVPNLYVDGGLSKSLRRQR
jgi:hypothetical protein